MTVSSAKGTPVTSHQSPYFQPIPLPRGLHQHSIESSIVTEGHYDASFETEDLAASFDVEGANYQNYDPYAEEPTILSNGHYKLTPEEARLAVTRDQDLDMLGLSPANVSSTSAPVSVGQSKGSKASSPAVPTPSSGAGPQEGRQGEDISPGLSLHFSRS